MKFEDLEIWDTVKGFENYKVSSKGRVYNSTTGRYKAPNRNKHGYLKVDLYKENKRTPKSIHRLVAEAFYFVENFETQVIDHKDRNITNNVLLNLRPCSLRQNSYNCKIRSDNTSGYKGVSWNSRKKQWCVRMMINNRYRCLGYFGSKDKAHETYEKTAKQLHGEFYFEN